MSHWYVVFEQININ